MKLVSNDYKSKIIEYGKQIDSKIIYNNGEEDIVLGASQLNAITPSFEGSILKSVMKQLIIDSNEEIPKDTMINYQFGVFVDKYFQTTDEEYQANVDYYSYEDNVYTLLIEGTDYQIGDAITETIYNYQDYEYINYGDYIVYKAEKKEDTDSYEITCYDRMLYSMVKYELLGVTYPITIKNYISAICTKLGLTFANSSGTFANYDKEIPNELYLNSDNQDIGYTFRDVLDELAQVTASTICINNNNQLELRYISSSSVATLNESSLKNVNVNFGEKYGPINSIVLARASDSDSVYLQDEDSIALNGLCELKISENQIMNGNDRSEYLQDILDTLDGLEYYINNYSSTGITYLELCDKYNVSIGGNTYGCIMFNDEVNVTQGLEELIHTDMPQESETDYTKADKTDRRINQTTLIVDKHEQEIQALASKIVDLSSTEEGYGTVTLEDAHEGILHKIEIRGNISNVYPSNSNSLYGHSVIISDNLIVGQDKYISSGIPYDSAKKYPSANLYPKDSYLQVDDIQYKLDFDYLNYIDETCYDKYIYLEGKQWIERNVGIDSNGDMYVLDETVIEEKPDIYITVESYSTLTLLSHMNGILKVEYLLENQYTDVFATQGYVNSELKITTDEINAELNAKVNDDEIIAKLNLAIEDGKGIVTLKGNTVIIESDNFQLDETGHIDATSGEIGGFQLTESNFNNNISGLYDFSKYDLNIVKAFVLNYLEEGDNDIALYDMNGSGTLSAQDYSTIKSILIGTTENTKQASGKFVINSDNPKNCVQMLNSNNEPVVSMGVGGVNASVVATENLAVMDLADWESSSEAKGVYGNKNGELTATASVSSQAFINTSSETKKKNINKVKSGLDILKDIDIYTYNYNEENRKSNKKHYGVVIGDDYNYSTEITDNKNEGVDLYSFISVCCASIKEQQEEIEQLKEEIKSLKEEKDGKDKLSK